MNDSFKKLAWSLVLPASAATAQSTLYVLNGAPGDALGDAVCGTGDVNADLVADAVVTARFADGGRGAVRWVSGASGLVLREVLGAAAGDEFGAAVDDLGDIDQDGVRDLLVGAPQALSTGAAYVLSGADGSILRTVLGTGVGDRFGASVCALGDLDQDGVHDFAVGAPLDDDTGGNCGSATLFSGASGAMIRQHDGVTAAQFTGFALAHLADVDGDGVDELAVGEPVDFATTGNLPGRVRVFSGASGAQHFVIGGTAARDHFAAALADVGDYDGDGVHDLAAGAPQWTATGRGYARVLSGVDGHTLVQIDGDSIGERFGSALARAGDVDGDGRSELWIGAPLDDAGGLDAGSVRLASADGVALATLVGRGAGARLGAALAGNCDVNGDGQSDALLASSGDSVAGTGSGSVHFVSAAAVTLTPTSHVVEAQSFQPVGLFFDAGPAHAGERWYVLGSIHGIAPGLIHNGEHLPLNPGRYFDYTAKFLSTGLVQEPRGVLDALGRGQALFVPWNSPAWPHLIGLTFQHCFVVTDAQHTVVAVSNAAPITLLP